MSHFNSSVDPDPGFSDDMQLLFDVPLAAPEPANFTLDLSGDPEFLRDDANPHEVRVQLSAPGENPFQ